MTPETSVALWRSRAGHEQALSEDTLEVAGLVRSEVDFAGEAGGPPGARASPVGKRHCARPIHPVRTSIFSICRETAPRLTPPGNRGVLLTSVVDKIRLILPRQIAAAVLSCTIDKQRITGG